MRRKQYTDRLTVPRFIFLLLFLLFAFLAMMSESHNYTGAWIMLACWLILGLVNIVQKSS